MTDFALWLDGNEPYSPGDVLVLYDAVTSGGDYGTYGGTIDDLGRVFVKGWSGQQLALLSDKAIQSFLRLVQRRYTNGMDIESWYGLESALAKDNS